MTSFVRGHHVYLEIWESEIGNEHCLKREPNNKEDSNAIAVVREKQSSSVSERSTRLQTETMRSFVHPNEMTDDMEIIGHVPTLMAQNSKRWLSVAKFSFYLSWSFSLCPVEWKEFAERFAELFADQFATEFAIG